MKDLEVDSGLFQPEVRFADGQYLVIDSETGEVIESGDKFVADTEEKVNWVLRKILDAQSEVIAIQNTADVIAARAILENAAAMENRSTQRLKKLHDRFGADIGEYAKKQLDGKRGKTFNTVLGSISLRTVPEKIDILDSLAAHNWLKKNQPDAIRVERKIVVSFLSSETTEKIKKFFKLGKHIGFTVVPSSESVKITTGVKTKDGEKS